MGPVSLFWFMGRTVVSPTSRMSACWHGRRKLRPECTDRINNRELGHGDICRRGGRSYSSPGPPRPTSATADAWPPTQMIGMVVAVPTWRMRGELPVVYLTLYGTENKPFWAPFCLAPPQLQALRPYSYATAYTCVHDTSRRIFGDIRVKIYVIG